MVRHHGRAVDLHVGQRLHRLRALHGLTRQHLAAELGLNYQDIQKCENGGKRIHAGRLYLLARFFEVPVGYFFEGLPGVSRVSMSDALIATQRETQELVRAYNRIEHRQTRRRIYELVRIVATGGTTASG